MIVDDKVYSEVMDDLIDIKHKAVYRGDRETLHKAESIEWKLRNGSYIDLSEGAV